MINPRRKDLLESATRAGLPVVDIHDLKKKIEKMTGTPDAPVRDEGDVVAVVEYRDGTLIDSVFKVKR